MAENPRVKNVEKAFNNIGQHGHATTFRGEPAIPDIIASHVQGILTANNCYVLTSNNAHVYEEGYLLTLHKENDRLTNGKNTHVEGYNHPAGCQRLGNLMVVAMEDNEYKKGGVWLYSLKNEERLADEGPHLERNLFKHDDFGCGGAGVTTVDSKTIIATIDGNDLRFYTSKKPIEDGDFSKLFGTRLESEDEGCSTVSLVTQEDGDVFLIGMLRRNDDEDRGVLYRVDLEDKKIRKVADRHFITEHEHTVGPAGVSFRWGTGIQITSDGELFLLATQREFVANGCTINVFRA